MSLQLSEINPGPSAGAIGSASFVRVLRQRPAVSNVISSSAGEALPDFDREDLVMRLVAAFRGHPHISNVLTHICGSKWSRIEQAVRVIVSPATTRADLSLLAQNVIDLMWAERGVTGRIFKPYLQDLIARNVPDHAGRLLDQIARLSSASAMASRHPEATPATTAKASRDES